MDTETSSVSVRSTPEPPRIGVITLFSEADVILPPSAISIPRTIGRSPATDLCIEDPRVSREHVRLVPTFRGVRVIELGSRNGTFVDGRRIDQPVVAELGAVVRLGTTLLMVVGDVAAYRRVPLSSGDRLIGGPAIGRIRAEIADFARASAPVLIEGESGSGKELVALALHEQSGRSGPLVSINCSAIPKELVESELFGHLGGAFSGAQEARSGLFRTAHEGTLLLDELGELPSVAQAKLLRALEDGEVRPVGSDRAKRVDVRVVAATNRSLLAMVEAGNFREDLYHRIAAIRIRTPALGEHREDLPTLAMAFMDHREPCLSADVVEALLCRPWPGNVRQLRNVVRVAVTRAMADGSLYVLPEHLPQSPESEIPPESHEEQVLRAQLETALSVRGGNVSRVARDLGLRRPAVYEHLKRLKIDPKRYRTP